MTDSQNTVNLVIIGMQLNSTTDPVREMNDHQHPLPISPPISPPPPLSPPLLSPSPATVHRYATTTPASTRHGLNPPELICLATPPLPMRLSEARQANGGTSTPPGLFDGRRHRTGLRSKLNHRSNPNEYVEEPVFQDRSADGKPVHPSSSSSSSSSPSSPAQTSDSITASESKDKAPDRTAPSSDDQCKESIFCPRCHRCRCVKCQQSRRLPALHCCGGGGGGGQTTRWHCLPEQVVDCCSCLWCARAAYRRCSHDDDYDDDEDELEAMASSSSSPSSSASLSSSDALCSCTGRSCCRRWTVLAALTPCLPCLCLYWPMRSLLTACTACYNCRRRGCQCAVDDARLGGHGGGGAHHGGHGGGGALLIADELLSSNSSSSA